MKNIIATGAASIAAAIAGAFGKEGSDEIGGSTLNADPRATPVVHKFVDAVNTHIMAPAIRYDAPGQGVERARKREAAQRLANAKRNAQIDAIRADMPQSRQVYRALMRAEEKKIRSRRKMIALRSKLPGGAAVVRGPFITA